MTPSNKGMRLPVLSVKTHQAAPPPDGRPEELKYVAEGIERKPSTGRALNRRVTLRIRLPASIEGPPHTLGLLREVGLWLHGTHSC